MKIGKLPRSGSSSSSKQLFLAVEQFSLAIIIFAGSFIGLSFLSMTSTVALTQTSNHNTHNSVVSSPMPWGTLVDTKTTASFDWYLSTEELHASSDPQLVGKYAVLRQNLDFSYHRYYTAERTAFQDDLIDNMMSTTRVYDSSSQHYCRRPQQQPWVVFTAGAMGAGKSHTIRILSEQGVFPLEAFVVVDPDQIRKQFPELPVYLQHCPDKAGERTRKESGLVAEIAIDASIQAGYNVLVDGSLRNAAWYENYFEELRSKHPAVRIAILHVTAPRHVVFERALNRARETGRVVPPDLLERTMDQVPKSVARLEPMVDLCVEISNPGGGEYTLMTEAMTWASFRGHWAQTCAVHDRVGWSSRTHGQE